MILNHVLMILKELWRMAINNNLALREQLSLLIYIYFVEKIESYQETFANIKTSESPNSHFLYNSFITILEFLQEFADEPAFLQNLFFHNDCQLFSFPIINYLVRAFPKMVCFSIFFFMILG
jgi:hypothetical protein